MDTSTPITLPPRVLIVEDSAVSAFLYEAQIHRREPEFLVKTCTSMEAAIRELREFAPNIVLIDLGLPDSTPEETLAQFRPIKEQFGCCIIAMSGETPWETLSMAAGADDFMQKVLGEKASPLVNRITNLAAKCYHSSHS